MKVLQTIGYGHADARVRRIAVIAVVSVAVVGALLFFVSSKDDEPSQPSTPEVATPARGIVVGALFPEFRLTDVDGRTLTNETLAAKPVIIWFTAAWCVPCQIGARNVAQLDDELGGGEFDVLVVFVDPNENDQDLVRWREKFARQDWMVSFDNFNSPSDSVASKV
ncbi:MAG: TlpA family protein disulfide reductase, partial [Alphaproteobacteria bacterium]